MNLKKIFFCLSGFLFMLFSINSINAQTVPQAFNYQAVARDNSGNVLTNQLIGLRFSILENNSTLKYIETHTILTNQFGLLTASIGTGTIVSGTFNTINWSTGNYWLKVDMDPNGGSAYNAIGTSQLLTVPFAMYAASSGGGSGTSNWTDNTTYLSPADNPYAYVYDDKQDWVFKGELKNTTTGSEWTPTGSKAAIFGKSNGKPYQAGVHGVLGGYNNNEAGVVGSISTDIWGALGYIKSNTNYALYLKGNLGIEAGNYRTAFLTQTQSANITYTLPSAQGASNTYLKNNGFGGLSWATISGGATGPTGADGAAGATGATGATGSGSSDWTNNTTYLSPVDNSNAYVYDDTQNWVFKGVLKNTSAGTGWTSYNSKAAIYGATNSKSYQAGVYGYATSSNEDEAGVIGAYSGSTWGAMGYYKHSTSWGAYISGKFGFNSGSYYSAFQTGTQSANITYILPVSQGAAGTYLTNNGSGVLSWATVSGGSLPSGTSGQTLRYDGSNWVANSLFYNDGTHIGIGTTSPLSYTTLHVASTLDNAGYYTSNKTSSVVDVLYGEYLGTGNYDARAVRGDAVAAPGYGYGGDFTGGYRGVNAFADATSFTGYAYGVYAKSTGTTGTRYGVYGDAYGGTTNYGVYCDGDGHYTGTWTGASDKKFKKDIVEYKDALSNVLKLKPVTYTMKTEEYPDMGFSAGTQIGFIAQDMETVFPTLVKNEVHPGATKEAPAIEYKGVNYIGLVPVLVKAMQEQDAKIEKQNQEILLLKQEIQNLKK